MRPAVLADTGPLYAAADPDDAHHKRSRRELRRLGDENHEIMVAYPTLLEAYTLVLFRLGEAGGLALAGRYGGRCPGQSQRGGLSACVVRVQSLKDQSITLFDALVGHSGWEIRSGSVDLRPPLRCDARSRVALMLAARQQGRSPTGRYSLRPADAPNAINCYHAGQRCYPALLLPG